MKHKTMIKHVIDSLPLELGMGGAEDIGPPDIGTCDVGWREGPVEGLEAGVPW